MINLQSRVWIYQSNQAFTPTQKEEIKTMLQTFTSEWTAHNQQLKATFEIKYDQFIILIVDESQAGASGCSIDKSVRLMKDLEEKYSINLFDRFNIAYKAKNEILSVSREEFERLILNGIVNKETIVFNNLVSDYHAYLNNWEVALKDSWHAKVFQLEG
jgi:hypothetical protein